jgi:hypothetical protein
MRGPIDTSFLTRLADQQALGRQMRAQANVTWGKN